MSDGELTLGEAYELKFAAERRCTHPDDWVSRGNSTYTADACWSCLCDVVLDPNPPAEAPDG